MSLPALWNRLNPGLEWTGVCVKCVSKPPHHPLGPTTDCLLRRKRADDVRSVEPNLLLYMCGSRFDLQLRGLDP